jgi:hypothetical protein
MRKLLRFSILFCAYFVLNNLYSENNTAQKYSSSCTAYTDFYGPLKTGYTMGDAIRYAVGGGGVSNLYSPNGGMPLSITNLSVAQDVTDFGKNTYNLYNAIGYLYAGWLIFNNVLYGKLSKIDDTNPKLTFYNARDLWISEYRQDAQSALDKFDNSKNFCSMIEIPSSYSPLMPPQVTHWLDQQMPFYYNPSSYQTNRDQNLHKIYSGTGVVSYCSVGYNYVIPGDGSQTYGNDSFTNVSAQHTAPDWASQSSGWCPNSGSGNWIPVVMNNNNQWYVAPTIQFFGGRIAHILGVIVNDVPWSSHLNSSGATGPVTSTTSSATSAASSSTTSPTFHNPLISGSSTTLPMFAIMSGGSFKATDPSIAEMIQPSQAHFGSLKSFITNLSIPTSGLTLSQQYLRNHILPTVSRLASVCSYSISSNINSKNLIKINDDLVTAYDQGVVVAIQNNTGDNLTVKQGTSKIGILSSGINNFYLHTASLMPSSSSAAGGSAATTSSEPIQTNIISIIDEPEQNSLSGTDYSNLSVALYIQVLSGDQFNQIVEAVNTNLNTVFSSALTSGALNWNHNQLAVASSLPVSSGKTSSDTTPYLIISNFDTQGAVKSPSTLSTDTNTVLSYRIQAIDISQFSGKPYLLTLQINKKDLSSGISMDNKSNKNSQGSISSKNEPQKDLYKLTAGVEGVGFLYPSILSCDLYTWQSVTNTKEGNGDYSKIPLLIIPDFVWKSRTKGLQAYYLIWLMSYAAALTECSYNGVGFGDRFAMYDKVFGLFSDEKYRVVVDAQGQLASGEVLELDDAVKIMGSDTWDAGNGFNQDIPILNLSAGPSANSKGAPFVNLSATFGTSKINTTNISDSNGTFKTAYGLPYSNIMMFSVPAQALADGVNIEMAQPTAGNYQLVITSTKDYKDQDDNTVLAGSILAAPQVFIDPDLYNIANVVFDFLHVQGSTDWQSPQKIPASKIPAVQTAVAQNNQKLQFNLKKSSAKSLNITYSIDSHSSVVSSSTTTQVIAKTTPTAKQQSAAKIAPKAKIQSVVQASSNVTPAVTNPVAKNTAVGTAPRVTSIPKTVATTSATPSTTNPNQEIN